MRPYLAVLIALLPITFVLIWKIIHENRYARWKKEAQQLIDKILKADRN